MKIAAVLLHHRESLQSVIFITLTPSIDGECPLGPLCEVLWRSDANRRSLKA